MARILEGYPVAAALDASTASKVEGLKSRGVKPVLAIVRSGDSDDALAYERGAASRCTQLGMGVRRIVLPEDAGQNDLMTLVANLNVDADVHGVLLLLPLAERFNQAEALRALDPTKDVDGATEYSFARVYAGCGDGFAPCTAAACMNMLDYYGVACEGKQAVVIGSSLVVGRPVAMMLLAHDATPTICHIKTEDVPSITRAAEIIIVATGCTEQIGARYFSSGQVVIDVGIGWSDEKQKLCGDVAFDEVESLVAALSPVPGGVGAVTASVLASHVAEAAERLAGC